MNGNAPDESSRFLTTHIADTPHSDTELQSTTSERTNVQPKSEGWSFCRLRKQTALRCKIEEVRPETKNEDEKLSTEIMQFHMLSCAVLVLLRHIYPFENTENMVISGCVWRPCFLTNRIMLQFTEKWTQKRGSP